MLIPIIHPARYMQSFYSAPHLRPPMALQYAVWTMGSLGHEKYSSYHDAFHRRCRRYLEEDELKVGSQAEPHGSFLAPDISLGSLS